MDSTETTASASSPSATHPWKPLTRNQRRVLGVLVEKSKTTPDVYPMSLNGIKTGANQKSNRSPQLNLEEHQVEDVLYELRQLGCVVEVHSGGRVPKFKHQAYEWLDVDKAELAVMTELLLRGEQTIGELRARAARMEKSIVGVEELRPILEVLNDKQLIVELTPAGRGQVVTHNLYLPEELERLRNEFSNHDSSGDDSPSSASSINPSRSEPSSSRSARPSTDDPRLEKLQQQVTDLESSVTELRQQVVELRVLIES